MMKRYRHKVRRLAEGIGDAVFNRTYRRGQESWGDLAERVVYGNHSLDDSVPEYETEAALRLTKKGACLWAGRHLQHGDHEQKGKSLDMFANCSTSGTSFIMFYLLLCGSGVGRLYDSDVILTDWSKIPKLSCCLSKNHPDYNDCAPFVMDVKFVPKDSEVWIVGDSRLEWAQIIEKLENIAYQAHKDPQYSPPFTEVFLDFSPIRHKGVPIRGVQNKPAPGPKAFIEAIIGIDSYAQAIKSSPDPLWKQALIIDDLIAQCVLAGGSRRSSRIACKSWDDDGILDFVHIKADGGLQTANNSVLARKDFWDKVSEGDVSATKLFNEITFNAYSHGSGEPAIINQDRLEDNREGLGLLTADNIINPKIFPISAVSKNLYTDLIAISRTRPYIMIVNPCAEINLHFLCGYCILFDLAIYNCDNAVEMVEAGTIAARSLIRANKMTSLYQFEVERTNRIGVSLTGIFEYALKDFRLGFHRVIDHENRGRIFWATISGLREQILKDLVEQCALNGTTMPHTVFTIKPAGSVSKLFSLCEGAHLPSMRHYLRWVAMVNDDPLIAEYQELGYPTKVLTSYPNTTIVGFPTIPTICTLPGGENFKTSSEVTPDEQYQWLRLLEKYWIGEKYGSQISYTLKFLPQETSFEQFKATVLAHHPFVKCCSWMFQGDLSNTPYEYLPEEPIAKEDFVELKEKIDNKRRLLGYEVAEQVDMTLLECQSGRCPL